MEAKKILTQIPITGIDSAGKTGKTRSLAQDTNPPVTIPIKGSSFVINSQKMAGVKLATGTIQRKSQNVG
ncbi:MAG: hypothetical protein JSU61_10715 [Fidelibacterota bacterium]|nr:MAG: hypothetical protein JSU61_10715 [Candidatus Neomarinimicrobiota bacterium]